MSPPESPGPPRPRLLLGALATFASGLAVMAHEVVWLRAARRLLGADATSVAVTLALVLGGLALGARVAARLAERADARVALGTYAVLELAAALWSAAVPQATAWLLGPSAWLYRALGPGLGLDAASAALVAPLLLVPAALAGAALPLVVGAMGPGKTAARRAGILYALHALGGAAGAVAAAFWLVPELGLPGTAVAGALAQGAAAMCGFFAFRWTPAGAPATGVLPAPTGPAERAPRRDAGWLVAAAALAGASSLALQGTWTRLGVLALGPTAQSFALVAALHVLALAVGSALAAAAAPRARAPAAWAAVLFALAGAATVAGVGPLGELPARAAGVFRGGPDPLALALLVAPIVVPPVALMSGAFPFLVAALGAERRPGHAVGVLLAASSAGNVAGAFLPSLLIPWYGLAGACLSGALGLLAAGAVALPAALRGAPGRLPAAPRHAAAFLAAVTAALLLAGYAPGRFDPARLATGPYLYAAATALPSGRVIYAEDGPEASVVVREGGGDRTLQIDGKVDGSAIGDARTQTLVGLVPTLLPQHPSDALVIGLGTGMTADAVRSVPGVRHVEVAELVGPVVRAARRFADVTERVLADRRLVVIPVDGARHLRATSHTYDVIVSEPSNPWVAGMSDLFAIETFRAAHAALRPGGVAAFWFHGYATSDTIARDIVRTFRRVFASATLWEIVPGQDYLLVGQRGRAYLDLGRLAERAAEPGVARRLRRAGLEDATALVSRLALAGSAIDRFAGDGRVLEARDGRLELVAPRAMRQDASLALLRRLERVPPALALADVELLDGGGVRVGAAIEAGRLVRRMIRRAVARDEDGAVRAGERAVGLVDGDRTTRTLLARVLLGRAKAHTVAFERGPARDVLFSVLELEPEPAERVEALRTLGDLEAQLHRWDGALERYLQALRMAPRDIELHRAAAVCFERLGARDAARRELDIIRRLAGRRR